MTPSDRPAPAHDAAPHDDARHDDARHSSAPHDSAPHGAPLHDAPPERLSIGVQIINLVAVILPLAGLVAAIVLLWGPGFSWVHLGLLVGMYLAAGFGVTIGYHRLFTHRSFEAPRAVQAILAILGGMAVQGPLLKWVAIHRRHHQHSDHEDDPHSPHVHGGSVIGVLRGMWHAHMGWIFRPDPPALWRYVPDLSSDRFVRALSSTFGLWAALGLILPALLGGLLTLSWTGALLGFIWGGLARIFIGHHATWSINSVCHLWGTQPFRSHDHSRNNPVFGVLAMGEGWHNNHHAFPASARHGLRWWEFDASYCIIRFMELLRLARNVRVPAAQTIAAKRNHEG